MGLYINDVKYDLINFKKVKDNLIKIKYNNEDSLIIIPDFFFNTYNISENFGLKKI